MGIDIQALRFLVRARRAGVSFERTISIGRQDLLVTAEQIAGELPRCGIACTPDRAAELIAAHDRFAEGLLGELGARTADSLDRSDFEGATIVHDLNLPIPDALAASYDAVLEIGTLEHVFDFPRAVRNTLELVRVGGHLLMVTPCNNFMGHGFYQFSPELLYRVLCQANGFDVEEMIYCPAFTGQEWYRVADPAEVRTRAEHNNGRPSFLMVRAVRTSRVPIFATHPQQSDYAAEWAQRSDKGRDPQRLSFFTDRLESNTRNGGTMAGRLRAAARAVVPRRLIEMVRLYQAARRQHDPPDPRFFTPVDPSAAPGPGASPAAGGARAQTRTRP